MACFAATLKSWAKTVVAEPNEISVINVKNNFFIVTLFYHKDKKYSCFYNVGYQSFSKYGKIGKRGGGLCFGEINYSSGPLRYY